MSLRDKLPKISFKRIVQAIKSPTFLGFAAVSAALTMYLYWSSGTEGYEKFILTVTAIALEGLKLYCLLIGNIYMDYLKIIAKERGIKTKQLFKVDDIARAIRRAAIGMYAVYALSAAVSIFGSYNFTLSAIDKSVRMNLAQQSSYRTPEMIKLASEIKFFDKEILRLQGQIDKNTDDWKTYGPEYQSIKDRIQKKIDTDVAQQTKYEQQKNTDELSLAQLQANAESQTAVIKKTSFQIMAENWSTEKHPITEQGILMVLLLLTSVLIELGLIVTSPHEDTFGVFKKVSETTEKHNGGNELPPWSGMTPEEIESTIQVTGKLPEAPKKARKPRVKKVAPEVVAVPEPVGNAVEEAAERASQFISTLWEDKAEVKDDIQADVISAKPERVEVRNAPIFSFLKNILPEDGNPGFIRKENISLEPAITNVQAKEIFNNLQRAKGPTGYPVFEFRRDHGKWFSNYSLNDIVEMFSKGSLYI